MLATHRDKTQKLLSGLPPCYRTDAEKNEVFLRMLQNFSFSLNDIVRNSRISLQEVVENRSWLLRGRVRELFDEHATDFGNLKMKFFEPGFRRQIKELIAEDQGISPSNFLNVEIFKLEIKKRICEAEADSKLLVDKVRQAVEGVLDEIIDHCFGRFEELARQIK